MPARARVRTANEQGAPSRSRQKQTFILWCRPPASHPMQRITSWLAVIFLLGCVVLGGLLFKEKTTVTQLSLRWDTAEKETQKRIAGLQHQVAAASRSASGGPTVIH